MKKQYYIGVLMLLLSLVGCGSNTSVAPDDRVSLQGGDTISFVMDDFIYYVSRSIFQFEYDGREYLLFQNDRTRGKACFLIFDIENQKLFKTVPLHEEGPDGIPVIFGGWPLGMDRFIVTTNSAYFCIVDGEGHVLRRYELWDDTNDDEEDKVFPNYCISCYYSYYASPGIVRDSLLYFKQDRVGYPREPGDWKSISMFARFNMNTGKPEKTGFMYPPLFDTKEITRTLSYDAEFSYACAGDDVAVSLYGSDSIYVSSDFEHVRAYDARSRYFPSVHPKPYNAYKDLLVWLQEVYLKHRYHHLLYDKYRDVFYRFALQPYQFPKGKLPTGEASGQEFSIVVLNNQYEVIGETRFPGNTYLYRMCFVGRKGLYLSLNNQENPCFDEDKLMFRCFTLQEK